MKVVIVMKLIERPNYLQKLIDLKGTPDIKVITGVRRSGKSKLLEEYTEWIKKMIQRQISFLLI